jgi:hypothetical protein
MTTPLPLHSSDPHGAARLVRLHQGVTTFAHSANEADLAARDAEQQVAAIRNRHPQYYGDAGVTVRHLLFLAAVVAAAIFQSVAESAPFTDLVTSLGWPAWTGKLLPLLVFVVDLYLAERSAHEQDEALPGQSAGAVHLLRWVMLLVVTAAVAAGRVAEMEKGDPNWLANTPTAEWVAGAFWVALTLVAHSFILFSGHHLVEAAGFVGVRVNTWGLNQKVRSNNREFRNRCRHANAVLLRYEEQRQRYEALHGTGSMPARGFDPITAATLNNYNTGTAVPPRPHQPQSAAPPVNAEVQSTPVADPDFGVGGTPSSPNLPGNGAQQNQRPGNIRDGEDEVRA